MLCRRPKEAYHRTFCKQPEKRLEQGKPGMYPWIVDQYADQASVQVCKAEEGFWLVCGVCTHCIWTIPEPAAGLCQ